MQDKLVSIITPCYNTGHIIHRLFDSILLQDYPAIEVIAVNDGSSDNTEEVIDNYKNKFEEKGYSLRYIYQENQGQSVAINCALKFVNGTYLCWPDSDDFYRVPNAISIFVKTFESLDEKYGVVRCLPTFVDEKTLQETRTKIVTEEFLKPDQFQNCINSRNFIWIPGNYMIKMVCFDRVVCNREIYHDKNAGQNFQILLPLLYQYQCKTLTASLFCVLERATSHSRGKYCTYESQREKFHSYDQTIIATLNTIRQLPKEEKNLYIRQMEERRALRNLALAIRFGKKAAAIEWYRQVRLANLRVSPKLIFKYWLLFFFNVSL